MEVRVRPLRPDDSFEVLPALLHAGCARLGALGLNDTAETAAHLVAYDGRLGWTVVGTVRWPGKTYRSVLLAKAL